MNIVKDRATSYVEGGQLEFDLDKIETHLLDLFRSVPTLQLEIKMVRFTFQESGSLKAVSDLRNKIISKPLNPDDSAILREHFTNNMSMADSFQRQIDLVIGFLTKTLDYTNKTDEKFSSTFYLEYCKQVLMLNDEQIQAAAG